MHGAESDGRAAQDLRADGSDGRDGRPEGDDSPLRDQQRREHQQRPHDEDLVYGITTAETSHTQEISRRQKQYILTMLVRVISIIVVVTVPGISWPIKIGLCLVATIIPYVAVVRANGGPTREKDPTNLMLGRPRQGELGSAQQGLPGPGDAGGSNGARDFIVGERVYRETPEEPGDSEGE